MKLLLKLAFLIIAIALCTLAAILYVTWVANKTTLEFQTKTRMMELAFLAMDKIDRRIIFERKSDLQAMASDPIIASRNSSPQDITKRLIDYRDIYKIYVSISFFDLNRVRIADTTGFHIGRQGPNHKFWNDVFQGRESVASEVALSESLNMQVIFFACPVKDENNEIFGVVVARVLTDKLYEILGKLSVSDEWNGNIRIDLIDREGKFIYSNYRRGNNASEMPPDWGMIKNVQGNIGVLATHAHEGHEESIAVFCRERGYLDFKGNGWTLIIHLPSRIVFTPLLELRAKWVLVVIPSVIIAIAVVLALSLRLAKPMERLKAAVAAFGAGNLETRVTAAGDDEIGELAKIFNQMADNFQKTTTSLSSLQKEIDERKKIETELKEARDRLNEQLKAVETSQKIMISMLDDNNQVREKLEANMTELKSAQDQLLQSEKLAAIGQLAAGVAHEINNPLGFINSNLQTLDKYLESLLAVIILMENMKKAIQEGDREGTQALVKSIDEAEEKMRFHFIVADIKNLMAESESGVSRIKKIVSDLRMFARSDDKDVMEPLNLEEILNGVINIVWNEIKYKAELKKEYGQIPLIQGNAQRLGQVFINILINASQAIETKGVIAVKTFVRGGFAHIQISDTGKGISKENLQKIFLPFFTTKDKKHGTGLGLSISYEIVKKHNGEIKVESEVGQGSVFSVILPVA